MNIPHHLLHPRYWPTWLGLALLRVLVVLPQPVRMGIGRWLSRALRPLIKRRVQITDVNIGLAFPELNEAQRRQRVHGHIESQFLGLIELGMAWWSSDREIIRLTHIDGIGNLKTALAEGKGVITVDGRMIENLHVDNARRAIAIADAIAALSDS